MLGLHFGASLGGFRLSLREVREFGKGVQRLDLR